jgi:Rrf2 family protein
MAVNCRFATGVHVLVLLAAEPEVLRTSTEIAEKLDTNPVVVRRVLASLQQASLIESQKGPTGGSRLVKTPNSISLAEVYKAVETGPLFHTPHVKAAGPVRVNVALERVFEGSMDALNRELDEIKLSHVLKRVQKGSKK